MAHEDALSDWKREVGAWLYVPMQAGYGDQLERDRLQCAASPPSWEKQVTSSIAREPRTAVARLQQESRCGIVRELFGPILGCLF